MDATRSADDVSMPATYSRPSSARWIDDTRNCEKYVEYEPQVRPPSSDRNRP
jgi:hypothetical protein